MFNFIAGLTGLGIIYGSKIYDDLIDERNLRSVYNYKRRCEEFYLKFIDEDLERKIISECKSEENILRFNLICREIGVSPKHENITDYHRFVILLVNQNKLPKSWLCESTYMSEKNWRCMYGGFNFVWGDPDDPFGATKVLSWVNKMIHNNGSDVNLLVFGGKRDDMMNAYIYTNIDVARREDSIVNYVTNKKYTWDCVLSSTDRIFNTKPLTFFWNAITDN